MSNSPAVRRPALVIVIAVIMFLGVPLSVLRAIASFLAAADLADGSAGGDADAMPPMIFVVEGAFFTVVAICSILLGIGLLRGSNAARVWTTIVIVVVAIQTALSLSSGHGWVLTSVIYLILLVVAGILLWSPKAGAFFRKNSTSVG